SKRTDLYALAAVLYEAVHGRPPFVVKSQDLGAFLRGIREGKRVRPPLPEGYPPAFSHWLDELLSADPTLRPPDANEALGRLNAALGTDHPLETAVTRAARLASGEPPGRGNQLEEIAKHLEPNAPRIVWLAGPAGSGKSRVLRWLASDAVRKGFEVYAPPPGAFAGESGLDLASLRDRAKGSRTLVLLDEVETASGSLSDFLERVAREGKEAPLRVVAAVRQSEIKDPRIKALVRDTGIVPTLARINLEPLDLDGARAMAQRASGNAAVSDARVTWLLEVSEGNPQTLESLLVEGLWEKGARARKAFVPKASRATHLDLLSKDGTAWLEALSVLGGNSDERTIATVAALDEGTAHDASREVELAGLARRHEDTWSPESRSLAEEVRQRIPPERLRDLYRSATQAFAASAFPPDPWRLAQLYAGAGDPERVIALAIEAADQSEARKDHGSTAERLAFAIARL